MTGKKLDTEGSHNGYEVTEVMVHGVVKKVVPTGKIVEIRIKAKPVDDETAEQIRGMLVR